MTTDNLDIQELITLLDSIRTIVNESINALIARVPYIGELANRALIGGKRIRGVLVILFSRALKGDETLAKRFSAIIEFIHAATLLHDDLIDDHEIRRGLPAFWKEYGAKLAILVGDFLFTIAGQFLKYISNEALRLLTTAIYKVTLGVILEAQPEYFTKDISKVYVLMNRLKTGELFGTAACLGVLASSRREYLRNAYKYGILTGEAYQIADDIFDLRLLREGAKGIDQKPLKLALLYFSEGDFSPEEILNIRDPEKLVKIADDIGLEEKMLKLINERISAGIKAIKPLPNSYEKRILEKAPRAMIEIMLRKG